MLSLKLFVTIILYITYFNYFFYHLMLISNLNITILCSSVMKA